ncbi:neuroendocrine protein 7B2 [Drosophila sulfurigaster albostrigata]|uniref:neuroendocrine protein 7B2 n=1 Tax=Drosophila sulfurigaster albostrigata TaxID=89887 RepID=UPI002D21E021|nr:neuroendocrine protein 7B2 [Drosophila sulfurigaster albostrigata]
MFAQPKGICLLLGCLAVLFEASVAVQGFQSKDSVFADVLLSELLNRMDNDMQVGYYDVDNEGDLEAAAAAAAAADKDNVDLVTRSEYTRLCNGGRDCMLQSANSNPSLRDQEFMQHSSLWGHQYVTGGMGEGQSRYNTIVKTDASLPAYCNPPNPCPEGYDMETMGGNCINDFQNTAIYSREFQAAQDCTCDNEHMFDCADQENAAANEADNSDMNAAVEKFLMQQFGNDNNVLSSANGVVKKAAHMAGLRMDTLPNPFLQVGPDDRLPIAAKKGNMLFH